MIFEDNGQVLAHYSCALWSDSVDKDDRKNLLYVDKAVCEGLFQVDMLLSFFLLNVNTYNFVVFLKQCSFCDRFGATINCMISSCKKVFHYPCASISGCFQDIKQLKLLCHDHLAEAEILCLFFLFKLSCFPTYSLHFSYLNSR